jgi:hypothetical protein
MPVSRKRKKTGTGRPVPRTRDQWPSLGPWAAVRSARDAVRSREELVAWLDSSPAAPAKGREVMLAEASERLLGWNRGPQWQQMEMVRAASGLPVTASTSPEEVPRLWAETRRRQLAGLPLYVMTSEMMDVCIAAAKTLTLADAEAIAAAEQHIAGYLLLPDDLLLDNPLATSRHRRHPGSVLVPVNGRGTGPWRPKPDAAGPDHPHPQMGQNLRRADAT